MKREVIVYRALEKVFDGATFEDFLIRPRMGRLFSRKDADLAMPLTRSITLKGLPVIPANMRTVTGGRMASVAALDGTISFLPRSYSIDDMVERIGFVKKQQAYVIENPLVISRKATLKEARHLIKTKNISGLLVEESPGSGILAGILSGRDIFGSDTALVEEYMTPHPGKVIFSLADISMEQAEELMNGMRKEKLPLLGSDSKIVGLITMRDLRAAKQKPYSTKDKKGRLMVGATIGAKRGSDYMERAEAAIAAGADIILMDIAHGHSVVIEEAVKRFRSKFSDAELIVGNIATREGAKFLVELGVDGIKVGIGPGSGCRTRLETGFGVAQLQAIREAWLAVNFDVSSGVPIIADGGIKHPGDIAKAIACGASTVMLGGLLAGTDEAPGIKYTDPGTKQLMKKYGGETSPEIKLDNYSESDDDNDDPDNSEGQMSPVPYIGEASNYFRRLRGSLQSAVSYAGVESLADFHKNITPCIESYISSLSEAARKESFHR